MPLWFILAFSSVALWALVNIADKYLVGHNSEREFPIGALVLFSCLTGILVSIGILIFTRGAFDIGIVDRSILVVSGMANATWIILYLNALNHDDASSVVPWFLLIPVFGYIFGYFILNETLTGRQLIGSLIVILGVIALSVRSHEGTLHFKWKTVTYMLPAALLGSLWGVLFKFVASDVGFWAASFWEYVGLGLIGILIFSFVPSYRRGFKDMLSHGGKRILTINGTSETATIVGNLLTNYALLLAPVTLVYLVGTFQPVVVLVYALIASRFAPSIIKEDMSFRILAPKLASIAVMISGSVLLFI
jgi:drug/metabolite transporter (DMT)-like permease